MDELTTEIAWTARELLDLLRRRQKLFVRDVRNRDEFSRDFRDSELVGGLECGGVATFLGDALKSRASLFI